MIYLQMIDTPADRSKFEQLYLEYRGLMFYVANKILQSEQDAEDAVHQAFLSVAENIEKIGEPDSPKTQGYLITITQMVALDEQMQGIPAAYEGENALTACILKLPARYREVILLRYFQGYSVKEIAGILHLSVAAATKLLQRAKNKLKDLYEKEDTL